MANEREILAPGPNGPLAGSWAEALTPGAPVALILPGSGPTDRDGNSPLGVAAAPYRLLAEALAPLGVGSVRIDKRGMFGSATAVADANAVTISDYVEDVNAWSETIRGTTGNDCVWLIGHSEGGLVALAAINSGAAHVCGLVLIAAPGRPLGEVMRDQLAGNPHNAPYLAAFLKAIDTLEKGGEVEVSEEEPVVRQLFAPQVQAFLRDLFSHDPTAMIAKVELPILIMQGGRDIQVGDIDAARLQAARPEAERLDLSTMNHVLKDVPDDIAENLASYGNQSLPLAGGVAEAIARFILAN